MGIFQNIFGPIESTSEIATIDSLKSSHPDSYIHPTIATRTFFSDRQFEETNERVINNKSKMKAPEPPEIRLIKTPRRNARSNSLSRYGSWGYMMLGMLMCSVVLLMCGIWECIRRVQKNDVLERFVNNGEPMETLSPEDQNDDNNCPQYEPPPPYSSLFPLAKDFNSLAGSDNSAPPSIYFTTLSATILPSAPSAPASIEPQLPQISQSSRHTRSDRDHGRSSLA